MTSVRVIAACTLLLATVGACSDRGNAGNATIAGEATPATVRANEQFAKSLDLADQQDFEDAKRGFIARPTGKILGPDGTVMIDFDAWAFLEGTPTPTVNPSLWRHAALNAQIGLFKVTDGIHQLRGFGHSSMTLIDGKTGWIVVDPLTSREAATAAIAFARKHLGNHAVSAVIFTHTATSITSGARWASSRPPRSPRATSR